MAVSVQRQHSAPQRPQDGQAELRHGEDSAARAIASRRSLKLMICLTAREKAVQELPRVVQRGSPSKAAALPRPTRQPIQRTHRESRRLRKTRSPSLRAVPECLPSQKEEKEEGKEEEEEEDEDEEEEEGVETILGVTCCICLQCRKFKSFAVMRNAMKHL